MGLDIVELAMEVEQAFGIDLPDERMSEVVAAGQLHGLVLEILSGSAQIAECQVCNAYKYNLDGSDDLRCSRCGSAYHFPTSVNSDSVWKTLVDIIGEAAGVDSDQIQPDTNFVNDLHMD